jgi:hypothetical protein
MRIAVWRGKRWATFALGSYQPLSAALQALFETDFVHDARVDCDSVVRMPNDTVTITQIAKSLRIDPKTARARLRRLKRGVPKTVTDTRWAWSKDKAATVKRLLHKA